MCRGDLGHRRERRVGDPDAARVVEVGDHDGARRGGDRPRHRRRVDLEAVLEAALEAADPGAEVAGGGEQRLVGRVLDQHLVVRLEERRERQVVGHRRADREHHVLGRDAAPPRQALQERCVAVDARAVDLEVGERDRKLRQRVGRDVALDQVEARLRVELRPLHVDGAGRAPRLRRGRAAHAGGGAGARAFAPRRLQSRYAGMPASRIATPMPVLSGYL